MTEQSVNSNRAAWLVKSDSPLEVKAASVLHAKPDQLVVKVRAIAINPVDWILQCLPVFPHLKLPAILGSDVAGEVVEVGSNVTRFQVGDRVLGLACGADKRGNNASEGAFQNFVVLRENLVSTLPHTVSFEEACVLPLGLSTAACGLYQKDFLALPYPTTSPTQTNKTLIVWGASTSVGCNAVQLACASGYDVIATASPKNFDFVKKLGAKEVFDYRSTTVVKDMIQSLNGKQCAGAMAIGNGSAEACISILSKVEGNPFVAQVSLPLGSGDLTTALGKVRAFMTVFQFNVMLWLRSKSNRVGVKFVFGSDLMENEIGHAIFRDFLPEALIKNQFAFAPSPTVVGEGLEKVQEALDLNKKGVSATKVVVTLS